jgi:integrase/recombinase XerD
MPLLLTIWVKLATQNSVKAATVKKNSFMKNNRNGKASVLSEQDYLKIRKCIRSKKYKLLLDIARFTGERWGAIRQLSVSDIWDDSWKVRDSITFRAITRKANTKGKRKTRECPIHPQLRELLEAYRPTEASCWLFPSKSDISSPLSLRTADAVLRRAVAEAGLGHKGISTHSTRRTFITRLWEKGVDLHTLQELTGHSDTKTLREYIETDPERVNSALALL